MTIVHPLTYLRAPLANIFVAFEAVESSCDMPLLRQDTTGDDNSSDSSYSRRFSLAAGTTFIVECTIKNLTLCPSSKYLWVLKLPKFRGWQFIIHMSSSCYNLIQKIGQCKRNKSPKYITIIIIMIKKTFVHLFFLNLSDTFCGWNDKINVISII